MFLYAQVRDLHAVDVQFLYYAQTLAVQQQGQGSAKHRRLTNPAAVVQSVSYYFLLFFFSSEVLICFKHCNSHNKQTKLPIQIILIVGAEECCGIKQ